MTLMQLDGATGVLVRSGNLQITLAVEPAGVPAALAVLETTGAALRTAHRTARDIVVERPQRDAVLRVSAPTGTTFPDGTRVGLVITVDVPGDTDVVRVPPVDVSGLSARDLVRFAPVEDRLRVLPGAAGAAEARRLTALGSATVAETRRLAAGRVPPLGGLRIVIDPSASMRRFVGPDDLGAVLEVFTGVREAVAAPEAPFEVLVWADQPRAVSGDDPLALVDEVASTLAATAPTVGFRSAGSVGPGLTVIVTDALPADGAALRTGSGSVCILALGEATSPSTGAGASAMMSTRHGPHVVGIPIPPGGGSLREAFTGGGLGGFVQGVLDSLRTGAY